MIFEGYLMGAPVYSSFDCEDGVIYCVDPMIFDIPRRKDCLPDMRYRINRLHFFLVNSVKENYGY